MQNRQSKFQIDWPRAYQAFLGSGLSVPKFLKTRLHEFSRDGRVPKSRMTVYFYLNQEREALKAAAQEEPSSRESRPEGGAQKPAAPELRRIPRGNIQVIEVSAAALEAARGRRTANPVSLPPAPQSPGLTLFHIRLPNGAAASFRTRHPEELALQMVLSGGRLP